MTYRSLAGSALMSCCLLLLQQPAVGQAELHLGNIEMNVDLAKNAADAVPDIPGVVKPRLYGLSQDFVYPDRALTFREEGVVTLSIGLDDTGFPATIGIVGSSGSENLDAAAVHRAENIRYIPAVRDKQPVPVTFKTNIQYYLPQLHHWKFLAPPAVPSTAPCGPFSKVPGCAPLYRTAPAEDIPLGLLRQAIAYESVGENQTAVERLDRAIAASDADPKLYVERARAVDRLGDHTRALADLNQALTLQPKLPEATFERAVVRDALKDFEGAAADFHVYAAGNPPCEQTAQLRDEAACKAGHETRLRDLDAVLTRDPNMFQWVADRCAERATTGAQPDLALADCEHALQLVAGDANRAPLALFLRGMVKWKAGDKDGGKTDMDAADQAMPGLSVQFAMIGITTGFKAVVNRPGQVTFSP